MTQFGVKPDQIEAVLKTVEDLAGVMDGDIGSATDAVTRALQGNWTAFTRLGIVIPENASQLEKWGAMAKQAADIGGGQLQAAAGGVEGQFNRLKNSVGNTFEAFGRLAAVTGLTSVLDDFRGGLDNISEAIGGMIPQSRDMETRFVRTQQTLAESAEAAERYAKGLKRIGEESDKVAKGHAAELRALDALKQREEQVAKAKLERDVATVKAWEREKKVTPDQAKNLINNLENGAKEQDFQRDDRYREAGIAVTEKLVGNEDARLNKAEAKAVEAARALAEEVKAQNEFDSQTDPIEKEIAELEKKRKAWLNAKGFSGSSEVIASKISPDLKAIDAEIAAKKALGQSIKEKFDAEHGPDRLREAQSNEANASRNAETVRASVEGRKAELLETLGVQRLSLDTQREVRGATRQAELIDTHGSAAAGAGQATQVFSTAAQDTTAIIQQFTRTAVGNQREMREVFMRALQELQQDHRKLDHRVRLMR